MCLPIVRSGGVCLSFPITLIPIFAIAVLSIVPIENIVNGCIAPAVPPFHVHIFRQIVRRIISCRPKMRLKMCIVRLFVQAMPVKVVQVAGLQLLHPRVQGVGDLGVSYDHVAKVMESTNE